MKKMKLIKELFEKLSGESKYFKIEYHIFEIK